MSGKGRVKHTVANFNGVSYDSSSSTALSVHHSKLGEALETHGVNVVGHSNATDGLWDGPAEQAFAAFAKAFQAWCAEGQRVMDAVSQGHKVQDATYNAITQSGVQALSSSDTGSGQS